MWWREALFQLCIQYQTSYKQLFFLSFIPVNLLQLLYSFDEKNREGKFKWANKLAFLLEVQGFGIDLSPPIMSMQGGSGPAGDDGHVRSFPDSRPSAPVHSNSCLNLAGFFILWLTWSLDLVSWGVSCGWQPCSPHLNRDEIESNLSVPRIQGCHGNTLIKSFEMSPHLIWL